MLNWFRKAQRVGPLLSVSLSIFLVGCATVVIDSTEWRPISDSAANFDVASKHCTQVAEGGADAQNVRLQMLGMLIGVVAGAGGSPSSKIGSMTGSMQGAQSSMRSGPTSERLLNDCMRDYGWTYRPNR